MTIMFAYNKGYDAYFSGITRNPYLENDDNYEQWEVGFKDAEMSDHGLFDNATEGNVMKNLRDLDFTNRSSTTSMPKSGFTSVSNGNKPTMAFGSSCHEKHPPLKIPGTDHVIFGGSCLYPIVKDADVYIGFDKAMEMTPRSWPWKVGTEFLFYIKDMSVPSSPDEFKKLVSWTLTQLQEGKKVHCGCIGGHGRTGTFLAALCKAAQPDLEDAITYVRTNYCKKAVESHAQIDFLHEHFGVKKVEGSKTYSDLGGFKSHKSSSGLSKSKFSSSGGSGKAKFAPQDNKRNMW